MEPLRNNHKNIGLLIGSMSSNYHEGIAIGAYEAAKELPVNLIILSGGPVHADNPLVQSRDELFNLIGSHNLDGLIVPLSSLTRYITPPEIEDFIAQFGQLPIVNIGVEHKGVINVLPNYRRGIEQLMEHYIVDHGYTRIVLLRGPENHASSNERHLHYIESLEKYQIPYDPSLVIYGDLERNSTSDFVKQLASTIDTYDAIIAINSNATISLIDSLVREGIRIPEDVAFAGMTGLSDDLYSSPELTFIDEDFQTLGAKALEKVYQAMSSTYDDDNLWIDMHLSIGESCGCQTKRMNSFSSHNNADIKALYEACLSTGNLDGFQKQLTTYITEHLSSKKIIDIIDTARYYHDAFIHHLTPLLNKTDSINAIDQFLRMINGVQRNAIRFRRHETLYYINFLRDIGNMMNSKYDMSIMDNYIIATLGVKDCYINIFEPNTNDQQLMHNIISIKDRVTYNNEVSLTQFDAHLILPPSTPTYESPYHLLVFPLIFRSSYYGNLILNYDATISGSALEALVTLISTTVMNELQIQDLLEAKSRFNDIVYNSNDWLFELDTQNIITFCSESVINILDYQAIEVQHQSLELLVIPGTRSCLSYMVEEKSFENIECCFFHKNHSIVYCTMTAMPTYKNNVFTGYRGVIKDITKQKRQEETIKHLASFDPLTGLQNRFMFKNRLSTLTTSYQHTDRQFAIIFINIDKFKKVNDTLGHQIGDQLLQLFSKSLKSSLRSLDQLARMSGDEFAILYEFGDDLSKVQGFITKIQAIISKPYDLNQQLIHITSSIGVALYPNDGMTSEDLFKSATSAIHRAKSSGLNKVIFYDQVMEKQNVKRLEMEILLRKALRSHSLILEYQPKVAIDTGLISGLEALVRIRQKDGSLIYPNMFIKLAEELDLIGELDRTVLSIVCDECHDLLTNDSHNLTVSVNLSPTQLTTPNLYQSYLNILQQHNLQPSRLHIELTESALVENEVTAFDNLQAFKQSGFSIDLDDFGTGYASLSTFGTYPVDTIKIDRSFIIDAVHSHKKFAIVKAISDMANSLGLQVIAEGVETLQQLKIVSALNIHQVQGYYFSKPKPLDQLIHQIHNGIAYTIPPLRD